MKKFTITFVAVLFAVAASAQSVSYTAFVYTDESLSNEIQKCSDQLGSQKNSNRGVLGDMLKDATINAAKGIASSHITSAFDLGVQSIASLITRRQRIKQEWKNTVEAENVFSTRIHTLSGLSDFYSTTSLSSPMDPTGMKFNGIGAIRKNGNDTLFYISMHIDRNKINRIVEHSMFELVLDTLIISPTHSNLPNSSFDTAFLWEDRDNYNMTISISITSSWMNELTQIFRDELLGEFYLSLPVKKHELDSNGFLRYVRHENQQSKYDILGCSFIVPRSYSGYLDSKGDAHPAWGTGEYQVSIDIKETCSLTKEYRNNWKKNRRARKKAARHGFNPVSTAWQYVTSQNWDEITQSWVITILQAPADVLSQEVIKDLKLEPTE